MVVSQNSFVEQAQQVLCHCTRSRSIYRWNPKLGRRKLTEIDLLFEWRKSLRLDRLGLQPLMLSGNSRYHVWFRWALPKFYHMPSGLAGSVALLWLLCCRRLASIDPRPRSVDSELDSASIWFCPVTLVICSHHFLMLLHLCLRLRCTAWDIFARPPWQIYS